MQSAASQVGIPAPERAVVRVWCGSGPGPPSSESRLWSKAGTAGKGGGALEARVSVTLLQTGRMRLVLALIIKMEKKKTKKVVQYFSCKGYYSP